MFPKASVIKSNSCFHVFMDKMARIERFVYIDLVTILWLYCENVVFTLGSIAVLNVVIFIKEFYDSVVTIAESFVNVGKWQLWMDMKQSDKLRLLSTVIFIINLSMDDQKFKCNMIWQSLFNYYLGFFQSLPSIFNITFG